MKQKIVGIYYLGYEQVQLVLREGSGAEFYFCPEKGSIPRIKIGADQREWWHIVDTVLHEAFEFAMERRQCRYHATEDTSRDHSAYLFVLTHTQFSDNCSKVAEFISAAVPDLSKAWRQWNKDKKDKKIKDPDNG